MQTDPVGVKDDLNLYAYVGGDPLNETDPTGMVAGVDDAAIVVGAVVIVAAAAVVCQPGSACNEGASEAITSVGEAVGEAHQDVVTAIVDKIVEWEEGRMEARRHKKNARPSTKEKHEKGQAAKQRSRGGEKADWKPDGGGARVPPRKRPPGHKGPWPPKKEPVKPPETPPEGAGNGNQATGGQPPPKPCLPDAEGKPGC